MVEKKCKICGKVFFIKNFHAKKGWGKFCSTECRTRGQYNGTWVRCASCGKEIYRTPRDFGNSRSKKFFCSVGCHCSWENKHSRCGVNAPNWVAGESVYRALLTRAGVEVKCRSCGIADPRLLAVHHKDSNRKNNDIRNLEWLCHNCHFLVHCC